MDPSSLGQPSDQVAIRGAVKRQGRVNCLVLLPEGRSNPRALLAGLEKRMAQVSILRHPAEVMVELASHPTAAIVVDEPCDPVSLAGLYQAVGRYYPKSACWIFNRLKDAGRGQLQPIQQWFNVQSGGARVNKQVRERQEQTGLHLVGNQDEPSQDKDVEISEKKVSNQDTDMPELGIPGSQVVSADELAMLMKPDPDEQDGTL